ncbi:disease resistance protein RPV1-like isoform X8 [Malus sylvestris]|uniref:disease resistance protein RPV1-like isoform X8 n=1 Tax=Malus sylvestris TaxID=3752 RepID=UPI0021AC099C|nr:disease resistance protein RPV1-like isoform X8 [Malus sylvestris]
MEGLQKLIGKILKDPPELGSASASFEPHRGTEGLAAALSSSDQSRILLNRPASRDMNNCSAITVDSAMTAHEVSSSSSSKSKLWNYDVFLSFSGEDTRRGFTGHLHQALVGKGYNTFMDEDDLKRGKEIRPELLRAIEESRISIIVFSKKYADSSWCLDELVKIMECGSKLEQHVLPIFYHVDPSDIRKQKGSLAPLFQKHEEDIRKEEDDKKGEAKRERLEQWREALTEAANLSGYDLKNTENGHEAKLIKKIIYENLWKWLPRTKNLHVAKFPVGINSRVQEIITYLSSGEGNKVLMVGIWGMGGLGKTTAAKAIYNQIHREFEFKSFLADVSDTTSKHGLVHLQKKLSFDIMDQEIKISTVDEGICQIKEQFSHRRVLVIMDNIDGAEQLNAIAGNHKWFGPGSRIIITTRDKHLLLKVDKVYPAQILNKGEALELFSWHAFGNRRPNEGYFQLSEKVVSYCGGLPLALEVLGSFLCERPPKVWNSQLEKLERTPDGKIIKPLRMSFDGLDDTEKATFLNISCFFIGENEDCVAKLLDVCGFSATVGINILSERCLVTVEDNKLNMHDLLREMARVIISEKSPGDPGKWSRLWNREDVTNVLTYKSGTEEVEGLALHLPCGFSTEAFANMKKLRLLRLYNVELNGEYKHLPKELIWLCWFGCPLKSIPDDFFNQDKLVVLEMRRSKLVQVWEGSKSLHNLKTLDLSHSYSLQKSPDFSQVPNLKELILKDCNSLSEIHPSIGHLKRLSLVNLRKCCELISLPRDFYKSKSVETLLLDGCWKFREVHEDIREMISLRTLEAADTAITQVPPSIVGLKNLTRLSLDRISVKHTTEELIQLRWEGCPLKSIPNDFFNQDKLLVLEMRCSSLVQVWEGFKSLHNLKTLDLSNSWSLQKSPNFSQVPNLERLILKECESLFEIHPSIGHLKRLSLVNLQICSNLRSLPRDFYKSKSVETLLLNYCSKFRQVHEDLGDMISLRILETNHTAIRQVPPSILRLKNLTRLSLSGVKLADDAIPKDLGSLISLQDLNFQGNELHTLPNLSGLSKLETLWLSECKQLHTITDLPTNLKFLLAQRCPALETMPSFSEMSNMRELIVSDSPKVIEVPGLDKSLNSMTWINMKMCTNLSAHLRKNILEGWTSCGFGGIFLNGNYVPDWFEFVNEGTKVTFDIPDGSNFEGLTLFCLYRSNGSSHLAIIVINNTQRTELRAYIGSEEYGYPPNGDDYLLQGQLSNNKLNLQGGDKVDILFENPSITIKRTGVNLVWGKDKSMKENMHDLDKAGYVFDTHPTRFYDEGGPSHDASDNNRPRKHMRTTIDD